MLTGALTIILSGCMIRPQPPAPVEEAKPAPVQSQPLPTVPPLPVIVPPPGTPESPEQPVPRIRHYDWNATIAPMVDNMLQAKGEESDSVLLVDSINNRTNGSLNVAQATQVLRNALSGNNRFTLVSVQQLALAKRQLGLSPQDSLGTRSKAIGIARNIGAQYVLYSSATGNVNTPMLQMQLLLVQSGEIIWSGKGDVQQQ